MDGSPDHATQLIIDSVNPGLVSLFTEEFVRQTAISRTQEQAPAEQSKPAVPEKAPEAPAPKEPEQAVPVKHRLTPEEKKSRKLSWTRSSADRRSQRRDAVYLPFVQSVLQGDDGVQGQD